MAVAWLLRPFILCLSTLLAFSPFSNSISNPEALLNFKKSLKNSNALDSWVPNTAPCKGDLPWNGLICQKGSVLGLQLEQMGLSGEIDIGALSEISGLRSVSIMNNYFSGTIPEFNRLGALKTLYLSGNQFSGEISPDYFSSMESMKKVWLSNNNFTGPIPSSLAKLSSLMELHIENNQFSGEIPPFGQPTLTEINLSNNKLEGEIPSGLSKFNASYFEGNPGLCGEKVGKDCKKTAESPPPSFSPSLSPPIGDNGDSKNTSRNTDLHEDKDGNKKYIAASITIGVMLLLVALIVRYMKKEEEFDVLGKNDPIEEPAVEVQVSVPNRRENTELSRKSGSSRKESQHGKGGVGGGGGIAELAMMNDELGVFGLPDLMKAAAEVLGNGGLGSSYKAVMANGVAVVVKRMREMNVLGKDEFDAEMRRLGSLRHGNILTPLAYHFTKDEKLLIYEYIPKGSLLYLLHGDRGPSHAELDWPARLNIVQGIAKGLSYLQTEFASVDLPHGNLKSSNVLLNSDNEPLLSDYGFNSLINSNNVAQVLFAYKAPEAANYTQISPKCDVYCLGVIILEILTGKFPSQYLNNTKGGTDVVEWVASAVGERRGTEWLDPEITSTTNSLGEMEQLLYIGAACTETNPDQRLDMSEAIRRIGEIKLEGGQEDRPMKV